MDVQLKAELKSRLRIVLMQLAQKPGDPELEARAEELTKQLQKLKD